MTATARYESLRFADPAINNGRLEVAFVDTGVAGWRDLVAGIRPGVEVALLHSGADGLVQMATWAESHAGYHAIHVLSHGSSGSLQLGTTDIDSASLADPAVQARLAALGQALTADGDLLLYGCAIAAGAAGQDFIDKLAAATGADVAASIDLTGTTSLGGDWELEKSTGAVEPTTIAAPTMADYKGILVDQTFNFDSSVVFNAVSKTATQTVGSYSLVASATASQIVDYAGSGTAAITRVGGSGDCLYFGLDAEESSVTFSMAGGQSFTLASFYIVNEEGGSIDFTLSTGGTNKTISVPDTGSGLLQVDVTAFPEAADRKSVV